MGKRGNKEEYFTVDTREVAEIIIGSESFFLPTHIDIQERIDTNYYKQKAKEYIPWRKMIRESEAKDITKYFRRKRLREKKAG